MTLVYCRIPLLLLIISSSYCDNVTPQNALESQLLLLLKKWRVSRLDTGIISLPSLTALKIPDVKNSYDRKGIKMTYALQKIKLIGLDSFLVKRLKVLENKESLEISILLHIPELILYADNYDIKGRAYLIYPLKGTGNMTVIFRDSDLNFKIQFLSTGGGTSTRVGDSRFDFNVHQLEADLVDSSWPINKVLNSEGVEFLASYHDDIEQALLYYVVPYVDRILANITVAQIIKTILNTNLK